MNVIDRARFGVLTAVAVASIAVPAGQATAAARNVCTGVAGCKVVAKVDVNGDGKSDQVGVVRSGTAEDGKITVRVLTAGGRLLKTSNALTFWGGGNGWFGAAAIDGRRGAELVVGSTAGAHTEFFRVITYRSGKLVTLKAPARLPGSASRWTMDCAYSSNIGVSRSVRKGVRYLTVRTAVRNDSGVGHHGRTTVYRWKSSRWVQLSTKAVRYRSDQSAFKICGWHIKGLRRYA